MREFPNVFLEDSAVLERNLLEKWATHRGQTEGPFDMPFDKLTVLSKVEGLTALSKAEGRSRRKGQGQHFKRYGQVTKVCTLAH